MAEDRTITIEEPEVLTFEAVRVGMTEDAWLYQFVNGHLNAMKSTAYAADLELKASIEASAMKSKYDALKASDPSKTDQIDALLATAVVEVPGEEEPAEG